MATEGKSRRKPFHFIEGKPSSNSEDAVVDKENQRPDTVADSRGNVVFKAVDRDPLHKTPALAQSKTFPPSTPVTRLALADLVGNFEDNGRTNGFEDTSPEEQVIWGYEPSQPLRTPVNRGKKRARSSSPPSSAKKQTSAHFAGNGEAFDLQNMQQTLKTPQPDPAAELWNRYTVNASASKGSMLAHLFQDSSPHSSATAGSVSGLRRWASCGLEFPTSVAKRKRTTGRFQGKGADVFGDAPAEEVQNTEPTVFKLGLLVEKIQETLAKPRSPAQAEAPSSSSPLPETGGFHHVPPASPLQHRGTSQRINDAEAALPTSATLSQERIEEPSLSPAKHGTSSDFGDADMDADMVEAIVSGTAATCVSQPQVPVTTSVDPVVPKPVQAAMVPQNGHGDSDEFGDDSDIFAADLEQVASLYDNALKGQPASVAVAAPKAPQAPVVAVPQPTNQPIVIDGASDDEFGGDDIDVEQLAAAEVSATQAFKASGMSQRPGQSDGHSIQRYKILDIAESTYTNSKGVRALEKVLMVECEKEKMLKSVTLRASWLPTPCSAGAYVHVVGNFTSAGQICIDDESDNLLILHPDHLVSATTVGDSFACMRRAVLQDRVKATSGANASALYGNVLHQTLQEALKANRWELDWLDETAHWVLTKHLETVFEIGMSIDQVLESVRGKLPEVQGWGEKFVRATPGPAAIVNELSGKGGAISINKLLDVEEHVWAPRFGLKGNIDATVQVAVDDSDGQRTLTIPLEIKTGKAKHVSHVSQTMLYTLLLSDRYDINIEFGLLYYMSHSLVSRVPSLQRELRNMIIQRNELAHYIREEVSLPPVLKNAHVCGSCFGKETCFIYHKLDEEGSGQELKPKEEFDRLVRWLKPKDQAFFKKWDRLLTKEESELRKFRRELWGLLSTEREKLGRCFSHVVLEPGTAFEQDDAAKINRYKYTLVKHKTNPGFSFTESQLNIGEPIVISDERGHYALANGYVTNVQKRRITVAVDRKLHNARVRQPDFDVQSNQTFAGIMDVSHEGQMSRPSQVVDDEPPVTYRIDKDEFSNGMANIRSNLISLMNDNVFRASELRQLIIHGEKPKFRPVASSHNVADSTQMAMNHDQRTAVDKIMSSIDYTLVLGMPGTGKTTTIAQIIRALVAKGKSVLLTSYQHSAVDNILLKLPDIDILRIGPVAKVHPDVQEFARLAAIPVSDLEELRRKWEEPPVVATTCLGTQHPIFQRRVFDYCIVDEASQITLPVCLGPIRMARTFVLVGDHFQLPPLVKNEEAIEGGLDVSLFKLLSDEHPEAVVNLATQYRMCADIMLLSNTLIYNGQLRCGNDAVASRSLKIPDVGALMQHHFSSRRAISMSPTRSVPPLSQAICPGPASSMCFLAQALAPATKVLFLNTDNIPSARETVSGSRVTNLAEAILTHQLITTFVDGGVAASEVGVVTFYRSQLALLKQHLKHLSDLELGTADKYQGRDKEVVIVSFVHNNDKAAVGALLEDWRRVNVAITRSKSKLLFVGSKKTLRGNELLGKLVNLCEERGWLMTLPATAIEGHRFNDIGITQTGATARSPSPSKKTSPGTKGTNRSMQASSTKPRRVLGESKTLGNGGNFRNGPPRVGLKRPSKVGQVSEKAILAGKPVLKDIINNAT